MSKKRRRKTTQENRRGRNPGKSARQISAWKKLLFACFTTAIFFGLAEVILYFAGVRPQFIERDPFVGFTSQIPLFVDKQDSGEIRVVETANNKLPWFNRQEFTRRKSPDTFRIVCLGGSTTYGRPYDDATSFCGWLRELLPAADPSRNWEVINAGGISYASYRVALVLEELAQYKPDLVIVYTGHNEFLENRTYDSLKETSPLVKSLTALLSHTRTYTAIHVLLRQGDDSVAPQAASNMLPGEVETRLDKGVGPDAFTRDDTLQEQILDHFQSNLGRIVDLARAVGAEVMLVTPASNLRDCSPFKSEARRDLKVPEQEELFAAVEQAETCLSQQSPNEALNAIERALQIDDRYAAAHFLRGRCLDQLKRYDEARASFSRARDEDVCPLRALSRIREIVLDVARDKRTPVIDFHELVEGESPQRIPGENLFLDHVHPTIDGHRLLSLTILSEMIRLGEVNVAADWGDAAIGQVKQTVESRIDQEANGKALRNLAKVFAWAGKQEEANRMALKAANLISTDSNTLYLAANALIETGDLDSAITKLHQVIAANPNDAQAVSSLGVAYQKKGLPIEAEQQYKKALEVDPDNASALNNLGALYSEGQKWEPALEYLQRAVAINPRYAKAYHNLAAVQVKQRNWSAAVKSLREAVSIDPNFAQAHADLGKVYASQHVIDKAVFHLRQGLRLDSELLMSANSLAWLLATTTNEEARDGQEALRWALHCAERTGYQNPGVFNTLAAAYAEVGDFRKAELWQTRALEQAPEPMKPMCRERIEMYQSGRPLRED